MQINNLVVVSDTHCGCQVGLCPPDGVDLDEGGTYTPSAFQLKLWERWDAFWNEFVPEATRGEPYAVVHNGDAIDGVHHRSTTQITQNLKDQRAIAVKVMRPIVEKCEGRYYHIRGTEAHVGQTAEDEETVAAELGAIPNAIGQHARYDLWKQIGDRHVAHLMHHIGSTGSQHYEATAVHKELMEEFLEAARWGREPPDIVIRSHRHRSIEISIPFKRRQDQVHTDKGISVVTPCWQGKGPFAWKIPGARLAEPQWGGIVVRVSDGELFTRAAVWTPERSPTE